MSRSGAPKKSKNKRAAGRSRGKPAAPPQGEAEALIGRYRNGRYTEALAEAKTFTERWPEQAVGWNVRATAAQALGQTDEAIRAYRRAARLEPANPATRNNLGLLLLEQGAADAARAEFEAALNHRPGFFEARFNHALALESSGAWPEAERAYRAILEQQPKLAAAHDRLGTVLAQQGQGAAALAAYDQAVHLAPATAGFHLNRGNVLHALGRIEEAERAYRRALELQPAYVEASNNLANLLIDEARLAEAEIAVRAGLEQAPWRTDLLGRLAAILRERGRFDEAIAAGREAVASAPDDAEAHNTLANALADAGDSDAAEAAYRKALELRPDSPEVVYHLATLRKPADPAAELERVTGLLAKTGWSAEAGAWLHYAAGKLAADSGASADTIFHHYGEGARLRRQTLDYDVDADCRQLAAMAEALPHERIAALAAGGHDDASPVFIVGMPRSGTSLVEQILASHPQVHGAGERRELGSLLTQWHRGRDEPYPTGLAALTPDEVGELGRAYCSALLADAPASERITDKMPGNFAYLGVIAAALPRAPIVHVRRNPLDTCLSCFSYRFAGRQAFSYDFAELGRYYRAYDRLMAHWRAVLPAGQLLEVQYEDLITAPEENTARLLHHCGLTWDARCLDFHRHDRAVRTASAEQVRQPLYRSAIGRWRAYAEHLGPLIEALGPLAPPEAHRGA